MDEIIRTLFSPPWLPLFSLAAGVSYALMILLFLKGWKRLPVFEKSGKHPEEKVTVVVACHNEEKNLPALTEALLSQDYPASLTEIVFVDDHSTDGTRQVLQQAAGAHPFIKTIENEGHGKKEALLTALKKCTTRWVFTTDADARPGPRWLSVTLAFAQDTACRFVAGPVETLPGKGFFSLFRSLEFYSLTGAGMGAAGLGHPLYCNGANLAWERTLFTSLPDPLRREIPGGDDVFLLHALKKYQLRAIRFLKSRKAAVTVTEKSGVLPFFRQRSRWASKSPAYRDRATLAAAVTVFLFNLTILFSTLAGFLMPAWWLWALFLYILKSVPDFIFLHSVTSFYHRRRLLWIFPPAQLFYPWYITVTALAGILSFPFRRKVWKG